MQEGLFLANYIYVDAGYRSLSFFKNSNLDTHHRQDGKGKSRISQNVSSIARVQGRLSVLWGFFYLPSL